MLFYRPQKICWSKVLWDWDNRQVLKTSILPIFCVRHKSDFWSLSSCVWEEGKGWQSHTQMLSVTGWRTTPMKRRRRKELFVLTLLRRSCAPGSGSQRRPQWGLATGGPWRPYGRPPFSRPLQKLTRWTVGFTRSFLCWLTAVHWELRSQFLCYLPFKLYTYICGHMWSSFTPVKLQLRANSSISEQLLDLGHFQNFDIIDCIGRLGFI